MGRQRIQGGRRRAQGQRASTALRRESASDRRREYEATFLTREQGVELLDAARGDRLEALFVLAATTGMRQGELLGALWRNVDLERREIRVLTQLARAKDEGAWALHEPKWGSKRTVTLPEMTVRALKAHRIRQHEERLRAGAAWHDGLVFATEIGTPISASNLLRRSFKPLLARAGLPPMRFHDLRHSSATIALAAGVPMRVVMATLGHSQVRTTLRYAHVARELADEAAAAMNRALGG